MMRHEFCSFVSKSFVAISSYFCFSHENSKVCCLGPLNNILQATV